jgi:hypothetical protein
MIHSRSLGDNRVLFYRPATHNQPRFLSFSTTPQPLLSSLLYHHFIYHAFTSVPSSSPSNSNGRRSHLVHRTCTHRRSAITTTDSNRVRTCQLQLVSQHHHLFATFHSHHPLYLQLKPMGTGLYGQSHPYPRVMHHRQVTRSHLPPRS